MGGGGGGPTPEQREIQKMNLAELKRAKATERRKIQGLQKSRSGKLSLLSGSATGIPMSRQSSTQALAAQAL